MAVCMHIGPCGPGCGSGVAPLTVGEGVAPLTVDGGGSYQGQGGTQVGKVGWSPDFRAENPGLGALKDALDSMAAEQRARGSAILVDPPQIEVDSPLHRIAAALERIAEQLSLPGLGDLGGTLHSNPAAPSEASTESQGTGRIAAGGPGSDAAPHSPVLDPQAELQRAERILVNNAEAALGIGDKDTWGALLGLAYALGWDGVVEDLNRAWREHKEAR